MVLYRKDHNKFQVNFSAFNSTYEVETPTCSARDLELILNQKNTNDKKYSLMMVIILYAEEIIASHTLLLFIYMIVNLYKLICANPDITLI